MASSMEVSLKTITEKQKKIGQRLALCEETVYEMLLAFIDLMGTQCPAKLRKVAKRWEDVRDEGQVVVKPKVKETFILFITVCFKSIYLKEMKPYFLSTLLMELMSHCVLRN